MLDIKVASIFECKSSIMHSSYAFAKWKETWRANPRSIYSWQCGPWWHFCLTEGLDTRFSVYCALSRRKFVLPLGISQIKALGSLPAGSVDKPCSPESDSLTINATLLLLLGWFSLYFKQPFTHPSPISFHYSQPDVPLHSIAISNLAINKEPFLFGFNGN